MPVPALPPFPAFRRHADADRRIASALTAVRSILGAEILETHKIELLNVCLWKLSEAEGTSKYQTRFVSAASCGQPLKELAHEHVYERAKLVRALLDGTMCADSLRNQAIACTVLRSEHRRLGEVSATADGWDRYREAGIAVIDRARATWQIAP